ncbi:hypothetical protein VTN00DRAFT_8724 [Thermoascus crustaceus]|uniref:uncharacterized protein n=1 Tax=Thermoascus crustaceus TaxID=5088 RepID=UPI0037424AA2
MSTAVAPATAAPLTAPPVDRDPSPKSYPTLAPSTSAAPAVSTPSRVSTASQDGSANRNASPDRRRSPPSAHSAGSAPKIVVKKEPPSSPSLQSNSRHRPRKLDLSGSVPAAGALSARPAGGPMTAREGMGMQEVGLACLSPGFQTQDPAMREQLQRSMTVRDQQRSIIESRLQKSAKGDGPDGSKPSDSSLFGSTKSSKRRPPPGLSIVPPAASQFANERVIQSAPLNQTFTGRHQPHPLTRHVANQTPNLASTSHIHHVPANQTNNRLPPISDVFGSDALGSRDRDATRNGFYQSSNSSQANNLPPLPSPGLPGNSSQMPKRPREYRSAEEAVHELSGGREELLPRIVHYGGHQPPTPPSPLLNNASKGAQQSNGAPSSTVHAQPQAVQHSSQGMSRRRSRHEYETDNGSPPLGNGPEPRYRNGPATGSGPNAAYHGPFGAGRDSPETQRRKKEEFLSLCARAWDLFHS